MNTGKSRILAYLHGLSEAKPLHFWAATGVGALSLFGMVAAFGIAPGTLELEQARQQQPVVENLRVNQSPAEDSSGADFVREERIQRGDTLSTLLRRLGAADDAAIDRLGKVPAAAPIFRQLSPGKNVTAHISEQGELLSLIFPLNGGRDQAVFIERKGGEFQAKSDALPVNTAIVMKSAEIRYSLFGATDAADIPDSIAMGLADIFGGNIDFHRDLRKGDRFSVVYESVTHLGKQVRTGRILAAEFVNNGKTFSAVWFESEPGKGGYYTAEGRNIRKAFLRSPLEFSRITSGFTQSRFHPILKQWRAHKGIDYGAPVGTRVKATGDGTVEFVGNQGGYGKVITLRHQGRYMTVYGHLSGFAKGLKKGVRVSQGEVIGFVGATGLASGSHLHYEFRVDNVHQNPLSIALPSAPPLAAEQLARFRVGSQPYLARIGLIRATNLALLD